MKKDMKAKYFAGALVIAAILIIPVVNSLITPDNREGNGNIQPVVHSANTGVHSLAVPQKLTPLHLEPTIQTTAFGEDIQISTSPNDENVPSIAVTTNRDNVVTLYDSQPTSTQSSINMAVSTDGGDSWPIQHTVDAEGFTEKPSVASQAFENQAIATWEPDPGEYPSGYPIYYLTDVTDPSTWGGGVQDWTDYGFYDFHDQKVNGYHLESSDAYWGAHVAIGSTTHEAGPCTEAPHFFYSIDNVEGYEGYVLINWFSSYNNSAHPSIDTDHPTGLFYAAWDFQNESTGTRDIGIAYSAHGEIYDGESSHWNESEITDDLWQYTCPSVSSAYGHQYVVFQTNENGNQDILCAHSTDNFDTYDLTTVVDSSDDETCPSVVSYGESASCTYFKNNNLYVIHSIDGGATWSEPEQVNDEEGSAVAEDDSAQVTEWGNIVWSDNRNGNPDIYYDNVGLPPAPVLEIKDVSGGFGVQATVENVGTGAAENVDWSITFDGPVFVGAEKTGTTTIPVGEQETIKSGLVLGLGEASITIEVGGTTTSTSGLVLGPFVLGL